MMIKFSPTILSLILVSLLTSPFAQAERVRGGNGGDAVVCLTPAGEHKNTRVLDLVEAEVLRLNVIHWQFATMSRREILKTVSLRYQLFDWLHHSRRYQRPYAQFVHQLHGDVHFAIGAGV